jgi:hypothetical protein
MFRHGRSLADHAACRSPPRPRPDPGEVGIRRADRRRGQVGALYKLAFGASYKELRNDSLSDVAKEAEEAVKALRVAKDKPGQRRAAEALDKAMKKLRERLK